MIVDANTLIKDATSKGKTIPVKKEIPKKGISNAGARMAFNTDATIVPKRRFCLEITP